MSKSVINFKIDSKVKEEAQNIARELGVPLSAVVNAQLRELIRTRTLSVSAEPRMTPYLERVIEGVERDREAGKNIIKTNSPEEALAHLGALWELTFIGTLTDASLNFRWSGRDNLSSDWWNL